MKSVPDIVLFEKDQVAKTLSGIRSGIYACYGDNQCFYVGRSNDLKKRVARLLNRKENYNVGLGYAVLASKQIRIDIFSHTNDLKLLERLYIAALNPQYNLYTNRATV